MNAPRMALWYEETGQMTVELCAFLPVALVIAMILFNSMSFLGQCEEFDRSARNAIRAYAVSPEYGQTKDVSLQKISGEIESQFDDPNVTCTVEARSEYQGIDVYQASMKYRPTLFGLRMADEILGVPLPALNHSTTLAVSAYKPGMLL